MYTHIVGIDEAGRGPLAGPVAVGVVAVPIHFSWDRIPDVADSKKLSEKVREAVWAAAKDCKKEGSIDYRVSMVSAAVIDRIGIVAAVRTASMRALDALSLQPAYTHIKLDGLLRAPDMFTSQETIVRGDQTEKEIGLASILAKVTRDRYMVHIAKKPQFAPYMFHVHKGYGTVAHRTAIGAHGLSAVHRRSYCRNLLEKNSVV